MASGYFDGFMAKAQELRTSVHTTATGAAAAAQGAAEGAAAKVQERIDAGKEGKQMVDEGGPDVEARLLAKKASMDAVASHERIVAMLTECIDAYKAAAVKLKESEPTAAEQNPSFTDLGKEYEENATKMAAALEMLTYSPSCPAISQAEKDGIAYLAIKTPYRKVASKAAELSESSGVAKVFREEEEVAVDERVETEAARKTSLGKFMDYLSIPPPSGEGAAGENATSSSAAPAAHSPEAAKSAQESTPQAVLQCQGEVAALEAAAGEKEMGGGLVIKVYTAEQQARLNVDEKGNSMVQFKPEFVPLLETEAPVLTPEVTLEAPDSNSAPHADAKAT